MKKIFNIQLVVIAIMMLCTNVLKAETVYTDGPLQYVIMSDDNIEIVEYFGEETEVKIPMAIGYHVVTSVRSNAFEGSSVTKILVPETLVYVEEGAFPRSALVEIYDAKGEIIGILQSAMDDDDDIRSDDPIVDPKNDDVDDDKPIVNPGDDTDDDKPIVNPGDDTDDDKPIVNPGDDTDDDKPIINPKNDDKPIVNPKSDDPIVISNDDGQTDTGEENANIDIDNETESKSIFEKISDFFKGNTNKEKEDKNNNNNNSNINTKEDDKEHETAPSSPKTEIVGIKPIGYVFIGGLIIIGVLVFVYIKKRKHKKQHE